MIRHALKSFSSKVEEGHYWKLLNLTAAQLSDYSVKMTFKPCTMLKQIVLQMIM